MIIKSKMHDGLLIQWTSRAVKEEYSLIGMYFDDLGIPQTIQRTSLYGQYIIEWDKED